MYSRGIQASVRLNYGKVGGFKGPIKGMERMSFKKIDIKRSGGRGIINEEKVVSIISNPKSRIVKSKPAYSKEARPKKLSVFLVTNYPQPLFISQTKR